MAAHAGLVNTSNVNEKNRDNFMKAPIILLATTLLGFYGPNTPAQTFESLHVFSTLHAGTNADGSAPRSGLTLSGGTLYGSVPGGNTNGFGAIYSVNTDGSGFTVLHSFSSPDGLRPEGGVVLSDGTLYGTANSGGTNDAGTVFSLNTNGTAFTVLHTFATNAVAGGFSLTNTDGSGPIAGLILSGNTLFGTASGGGTNGNGTVFSVNTDGSGFTLLHTFKAYTGSSPTNADGANPEADLLLADGTLYGTTRNGGTNGYGTLFAVNTNGSGFTVLHTFDSHNVNETNLDGWYPEGNLVISGDTLFGTASGGGADSDGTVFSVKTNGAGFTVLHSFAGGSDGAGPAAGLALSGGQLYGCTSDGGVNASGAIFALGTNGAGFNILYAFTHLQAATNSDGARPVATMLLSGNTLCGTTQFGGTGNGVVFSLAVLPDITSLNLAGSNIVLNAANGVAGESYAVLTSTDAEMPLSGWTPVMTNLVTNGGNFTITATNAVNFGAQQQFYILQMQ
jgi:uncharacterized repeat protein (TIGR03803 family)